MDIATVPFAVAGCGLSVAMPAHRPHNIPAGIYIRRSAFRRHPRELLRIELLVDGEPVVPVVTGRDGSLVLTAGRARIEIASGGPDGLRLAGRGCGVRLTGIWNTIIQPIPGGWAYTSIHHWRRYALRVAGAGEVALWSRWREDAGPESPHLTVTPGRGAWEIAIDGYGSTWVPPRRDPDTATAARAAAADWTAFAAAFPALPRRWAATVRAAQRLLWTCTVPPAGALTRPAVLMSRNWMDAVWSWDNWFNLTALASAHPRLAMDQALLMADHQDAHGAYPDSVDADGPLYTFSKPPVQGLLLRRLRRTDPRFLSTTRPAGGGTAGFAGAVAGATGVVGYPGAPPPERASGAPPRSLRLLNPARRRALYATLAASTRWWLTHRRWPGSALCHYLHGNDSGWDNSTMFDAGAPLEGPDLNAALVVQCGELALLAAGLGQATEAAGWRRQADRLRAALLRELWDGDGFAARRCVDGHRVRCRSLIPLMPLVLGEALPQPMRAALLAALPAFITDHGLATEDPASPDYAEDSYWRGPIWGPSTLLMVDALRGIGETATADRIATAFCRTCVRSGFAENFAATTGAPLRDPAYTWTASAFLCLARDLG